MRELLRGASYVLSGLRLLKRERGLLRYSLGPLLIGALALLLGLYGAVTLHDDALAWLWPSPEGEGVAGMTLSLVHALAQVVAFLLVTGIALALSLLISNIAAAPFNDLLSEAVEARLARHANQPRGLAFVLKDAGRSVRLELVKLVVYLVVIIPTALLSWLVPGLGTALYLVGVVPLTAAYFALDYVDWPAARRGWSVKARLGLLGRHKGRMLGFGLAVWALLSVPLLNLLLMPIAVVGGTLLFLDLAPAPLNPPGRSPSELGSASK